jgi:outer membrane immunogenic protein
MHNLAKGMLSTVSWLAFAATAGAADLVTKAPPPQAAPVMLWTGPYVGLSVGGYHHHASSRDFSPDLVGFPGFDGSLTDTSAFVSGHAGYNWQVNRFVLGVEADISSPSRSATIIYGPAFAPNTETFTTRVRWLSTVRGRVGVTFSNLLLYATGGLAIADISNVRTNPTLDVLARNEGVRTTGVVGAGAEYKLSQQWSVRIEGLWMKFPDATVNTIDAFGVPGLTYRTRFTNEVAMVRGGVSLSW